MRFKKIYAIAWSLCITALFGGYGQPGAFLRFGAGARSMALAGAYSTIGENADALIYNPAGLAGMEKWELTITHAQLFMDSRYEFLSFAQPLGRNGTFGIALADLGIADFDGRDEFNRQTGSFGSHDLAILAGYGNWFFHNAVKIGGSAKFWMSSMDDKSASGFGGIDIGLISKELWRRVKFSAAVQNLGSMEIAGDQLPITIRGGFGVRVIKELTLAADAEIAEKAIKPRIGAELKLFKMMMLRAGYNMTELTFGLGLDLERIMPSFSRYGRPNIDYCAATMNPLGSDFARISLTFKGREKVALADLNIENPCERLDEIFRNQLDKDGLIGAKANLVYGDCIFNYQSVQAPLENDPSFREAYSYLHNAYYGKFGKNWYRELMTTRGVDSVFSQRNHYMYAEASMHTKVSEETRQTVQNLINLGGADSTQYDLRLQYDLALLFDTLGYIDSAAIRYASIAGRDERELPEVAVPIRYLAMFRLARLLRLSSPDSAIALLDGIVRSYGWGFYSEDGNRMSYPMFPKYKDNSLADDALLLMGEIYSQKDGQENKRMALICFLDVLLFYPNAEAHIRKQACIRAADMYSILGMLSEEKNMRSRAEKI